MIRIWTEGLICPKITLHLSLTGSANGSGLIIFSVMNYSDVKTCNSFLQQNFQFWGEIPQERIACIFVEIPEKRIACIFMISRNY